MDSRPLGLAAGPDPLALLREWAERCPGDLWPDGKCSDCGVQDGSCIHARTAALLQKLDTG